MRRRSRPPRIPKAPIWRRSAALSIDTVAVWLISSFVTGLGGFLLFFFLWFFLRVIIALRNRGQSLGQWLFDMRVVNLEFGKIPGFQKLLQREAIVGLGAFFATTGISNLSPERGWALLAVLPLLVDCGFALGDEVYRQAFHDRIGETLIIQTRRGFSLDLRIRYWLDQFNSRVR